MGHEERSGEGEVSVRMSSEVLGLRPTTVFSPPSQRESLGFLTERTVGPCHRQTERWVNFFV